MSHHSRNDRGLSIFSPASASSLVLLSTPSKAARSTSWPLEILLNPFLNICANGCGLGYSEMFSQGFEAGGVSNIWQSFMSGSQPQQPQTPADKCLVHPLPFHTSTFSLVGRSKLPSRMVTVVPRSVDSTRTFSFLLLCGTFTGNVSHNSDAGRVTSRNLATGHGERNVL